MAILPTNVNVLFEPSNQRMPVTLGLDIPPGQAAGPLVRQCLYEQINFSYFEGTITNNVTVVAVPMILPAFFAGIGATDIRGFFLLRTGATEGGHKARADFFSDKGLGPHGCPTAVLARMNPDADGNSHSYFSFNNMRFYPFLMREFTVAYYICDEGSRSSRWPVYDVSHQGVALDQPVVYDATLGLLITRGARYLR